MNATPVAAAVATTPALRNGARAAYGAGALGTSLFSTVPGLLLLYFMTNVLGIPPGLAGLGVAVPKIWDMITDPIIGAWSDRTRSSWGRRRPWLLLGALTLPPTFIAMFAVPAFASMEARFAWVLAAFMAAALAFTFFQVPYVAMPAEMTDAPHEATVLVSWRMAFMAVGILVAGATAPMLVKGFGGGQGGYVAMSCVLAALAGVTMLWTFFGTARAPRVGATTAPSAFLANLLASLRERPFALLVGTMLIQLSAVGSLLAAIPYYARSVLGGNEDTVTVLFVALMVPALLAMPLCPRISRRLGKRRAFQLSLAVFGAGGLLLWVVPAGGLGLAAAIVVVMGLAYAGTQVYPFAMLPDLARADRDAGAAREGVLTGLFTASEKAGLALGALVAGLVLELTGYVKATGGAFVTQPDGAVMGIRLAISVAPAVLVLLSAALLAWYPDDRAHAPPRA